MWVNKSVDPEIIDKYKSVDNLLFEPICKHNSNVEIS